MIAQVDWIGENGFPYHAMLSDDGEWTCSEKRLDRVLNLKFGPDDHGIGFPYAAARACADYFQGHLHYFAPLTSQLGPDEVE